VSADAPFGYQWDQTGDRGNVSTIEALAVYEKESVNGALVLPPTTTDTTVMAVAVLPLTLPAAFTGAQPLCTDRYDLVRVLTTSVSSPGESCHRSDVSSWNVTSLTVSKGDGTKSTRWLSSSDVFTETSCGCGCHVDPMFTEDGGNGNAFIPSPNVHACVSGLFEPERFAGSCYVGSDTVAPIGWKLFPEDLPLWKQ
jgi:hypothetical protein